MCAFISSFALLSLICVLSAIELLGRSPSLDLTESVWTRNIWEKKLRSSPAQIIDAPSEVVWILFVRHVDKIIFCLFMSLFAISGSGQKKHSLLETKIPIYGAGFLSSAALILNAIQYLGNSESEKLKILNSKVTILVMEYLCVFAVLDSMRRKTFAIHCCGVIGAFYMIAAGFWYLSTFRARKETIEWNQVFEMVASAYTVLSASKSMAASVTTTAALFFFLLSRSVKINWNGCLRSACGLIFAMSMVFHAAKQLGPLEVESSHLLRSCNDLSVVLLLIMVCGSATILLSFYVWLFYAFAGLTAANMTLFGLWFLSSPDDVHSIVQDLNRAILDLVVMPCTLTGSISLLLTAFTLKQDKSSDSQSSRPPLLPAATVSAVLFVLNSMLILGPLEAPWWLPTLKRANVLFGGFLGATVLIIGSSHCLTVVGLALAAHAVHTAAACLESKDPPHVTVAVHGLSLALLIVALSRCKSKSPVEPHRITKTPAVKTVPPTHISVESTVSLVLCSWYEAVECLHSGQSSVPVFEACLWQALLSTGTSAEKFPQNAAASSMTTTQVLNSSDCVPSEAGAEFALPPCRIQARKTMQLWRLFPDQPLQDLLQLPR